MGVDETAVLQIRNATLREIAVELVVFIRRIASFDPSLDASVRALSRVKTRRLLARSNHPPDHEVAVELVRRQAELLAGESS